MRLRIAPCAVRKGGILYLYQVQKLWLGIFWIGIVMTDNIQEAKRYVKEIEEANKNTIDT